MARVRRKSGEDYTPQQIQAVINQLNQDKPITKVKACAILKITYNTTRLNKILAEFIADKEYSAKRRAELRSKPLSVGELDYIIKSYLEGSPMSEIVEKSFRSTGVVKRVLEKYKIPLRSSSNSYFNPLYLPDDCSPNNYIVGDLVYSARYNCVAEIEEAKGKEAYRIWLPSFNKFAIQPYWEMSDLRPIQAEFNLQIESMCKEDVHEHIFEGIKNAKKAKRK
jgi:hypothetical protein